MSAVTTLVCDGCGRGPVEEDRFPPGSMFSLSHPLSVVGTPANSMWQTVKTPRLTDEHYCPDCWKKMLEALSPSPCTKEEGV